MKALQITGENEFTIIEVARVKPAADQVTVQVEMVTTCPRWDINMMSNRDMFDANKKLDYPLAPGFPGHEMVGTIVEVGAHVQSLQVGDRVAALEHLPGQGAYAEYLNYREAEVMVIPETVSFKQAVSFELLKCVLIGLLQLDDMKGKSILISGLGPAGMLAIQAAKLLGAREVVGVDINRDKVDFINQLGIGTAMHPDDLADKRFDLGYDCVGAAGSVQALLERVDAHLVIFGVLKGQVVYPEHLWLKGTKLESYRYRSFGEEDKALLLDLVVNKGLDTACLQTHHVPLHKYQETIVLLKEQTAVKVYSYPKQDLHVDQHDYEGKS